MAHCAAFLQGKWEKKDAEMGENEMASSASVQRSTGSIVTIFLILCGIRKTEIRTQPVVLSIGIAKWVCVTCVCVCGAINIRRLCE